MNALQAAQLFNTLLNRRQQPGVQDAFNRANPSATGLSSWLSQKLGSGTNAGGAAGPTPGVLR